MKVFSAGNVNQLAALALVAADVGAALKRKRWP